MKNKNKNTMLPNTELHALLVKWNDTTTDYPKDKTLHELFEEQANKTPHNIAIIFEEQQLTYQELNQKANQLAHYLRKQGVKPETLVAVCVERSLEMIIGILGILKAGGAYVPLDPNYPLARIQYMLEDCCTPLVLTQKTLYPALLSQLQKSVTPLQIIYLDNDWPTIQKENINNIINLTKPENLIYVIYTSGTTGKPKGVCNIHRGIINRLHWMQTEYQLATSDRVLQKTPISFDVSVWEIFWPLITNACLVLASPHIYAHSACLLETIKKQKISVAHFVPSLLQYFIDDPAITECKTLRMVFVSGEALPIFVQKKFFSALNSELYNLYGPTEASIDVTHWNCKQKNTLSTIPIGKPIANTQIYILDQYLQPTPIGVTGEIHIGGDGLARGYLNWPNYTQEKFIRNPFISGRLYKTGDLGCWLPDGNIEYKGRLDDQIKIHGFRIEPAEIEAELMQYPGIKQATIVTRKTSVENDKQIVAFVTTYDNTISINTEKMRRFIRQSLPDYMVPNSFFVLDQLPLTPNGKTDKNALSVLAESLVLSSNNYVAPQTVIQQQLVTFWSETLNKDPAQISIYDNFFDLGGHSLLASAIITKTHANFGIDLSTCSLFDTPTIAELSYLIEQKLNAISTQVHSIVD